MRSRNAEWFAEEELTREIIAAFYYVYNALGFGFREAVYVAALERLLIRRGFKVAREVLVPIHFDGEIIAFDRLYMLVDDKVIVEAKARERLNRTDLPQLYNYIS